MSKEKWLLREVNSWVEQGVVMQDTAESIRGLYSKKNGTNALLIIFSIIGAVLIGTGIILISARNWYDFPIGVRIGIAFAPLILAQALSAYVVLKRMQSLAWREGVAIFLTLTVFTSVALVGQIFHLPGDFGSYVLVCGLLSLPIIYILWVTSPTIVYLWTILNWIAINSGTWYYVDEYIKFWFLLLALLIAPFIYMSIKNDRFGNKGQILGWITAVGGFLGILFLNMSLFDEGYLSVIPYVVYFGLIYVLDTLLYNKASSTAQRPFKIIGWLGSIVLLIIFSYSGVWDFEPFKEINILSLWPYGALSIVLFILAIGMFVKSKKEKDETAVAINVFLMPILVVFFNSIINIGPTIPAVIINLYLLTIGLLIILKGVTHISLGSTNIGMLLVCLIIILRFFDWELDLLHRGIAFVLIGIGFLAVNLYIIKKRKAVAEQ